MYIEEEQLTSLFNDRNWTIANNYHRRGTITRLDISYIEEEYTYQIDALTDTFDYYNHAHVLLDEHGNITEFSCDCPYCDKGTACAHVGAVLLFINELQPAQFPYTFDRELNRKEALEEWARQQQVLKVRHFLNNYKRLSEGEFEANLMNEKVGLKASLEIRDHNLTLSYKIGIDKYYVLKNILQFLELIDSQSRSNYGKHLSFIHHMDAFDELTKQNIAFLQTYVKEHKSEMTYGYYDKRYLPLDNRALDHFFTFFQEEGSASIDCTFTQEDIETIPLHIKKGTSAFVITTPLSLSSLYKGDEYWYQYDGHTFSRFTKAIHTFCSYILEELNKEQQIVIPCKDMQEFNTYVYSQIQDYVTLTGDPIDEYFDDVAQLACYVDVEETGDVSILSSYVKENGTTHLLFEETPPSSLPCDRVKALLQSYVDEIDKTTYKAIIIDEHKQMAFLQKGLSYLDKLCSVYISDAIKKLSAPKKASFQIGIHLESNLLNIDIASAQIPGKELYAVLKSYRKKKKYHRLKNGDLIALESENLEEVNTLVEDLHVQSNDLETGVISLPSYHAFEVDSLAEEAKHLEVARSKSFTKALKDFKKIDHDFYQLPESYQTVLRDYQTFGFQWLKTMKAYGFGGILADDMGLGKTLQMIALLEDEKQLNPTSTSIVVTPASLILNWEDEIQKFAKHLSCLCIHGSSSQRAILMKKVCDYDVIITSYDYLRRDYEQYSKMMFSHIILDEAQYIKNHTTKNANVVKQLKGSYRFALTGTPIENSLAELWSIFDFLMPGYLYNYHYFKKTYEKEIVKFQNEEVSKKLKHLVEPFILRRLKHDVLTELPDKIEQIQYMEFNEEEEKLYLANLSQINKDLQKKYQMEAVDHIQILAMMTRLRQLCCDPRLLYENITTPSSKLEGCMELIQNAKKSGKKVLLFSSFTSLLALLEQELKKSDLSYITLTGETKKEDRQKLVAAFQTKPIDVFLISLKAGGTGLNLTAAEIVIHLDPWWNMSAQNQATDRAYRIGQTKNVQVYKLIMKNTIEERILKLQEKKMDLSDSFTSGSEGSITSMKEEEIMDLFKL